MQSTLGTSPRERRRENPVPTHRLGSDDWLSPDSNTGLQEGLLFSVQGALRSRIGQTDNTTVQKTPGLLGLTVAYMVPLIVLN